jgi:hypothetical protein
MRLVSGHGCSRVIQDDQSHVCLIIDGIDYPGYGGGKEGGIPYECEADGIRFDMPDALGNSETCSHTETGVHHVKGHGVPQRIAADISAENGFLSFHGCLDRIERSAVRAACA